MASLVHDVACASPEQEKMYGSISQLILEGRLVTSCNEALTFTPALLNRDTSSCPASCFACTCLIRSNRIYMCPGN